jgi:phosphoenolpyruvate synthase/pyruvate phosphate dikinase
MSNFVTELKNDFPVSEIGGKAHSLSVLLSRGFNVPSGFVITSSAFFDFLKRNGLLEEIQRLASEITQDNFKEKSAQARKVILKGEISENIASEIERFLNRSSAKYVSIRSSAVSEDSLKASFAGLFDTFLNVKAELPLLLKSARNCWASLFNERAVAYRIRKGILHLEGMAVIIQEMIPAEVSGTAFTTHPDTKDEKLMVIESSWGLGEAIVSGLVMPDRYIIDKNNIRVVERILGRKKITVRPDKNGTTRVDTPKDRANTFCLDGILIKDLTKVCINIEGLFRYPQDIEWCIFKNKIWILQSRPITNLERGQK